MLRFLSFCLSLGLVSSGLIKYDQTQNGDYNIHLDLKNIDLIAFLDESSLNLGEYDYDYGELTLKPPAAPANETWSTAKPDSSTEPDSSGIAGETAAASGNGTSSAGNLTDATTTTTAPPASTTVKPHRRCGAGFYRDTSGRCRRLRRPIKLGSLLQQAKNQLNG